MLEYFAIDHEDNIQTFMDVVKRSAKEGWKLHSSNAYMIHNTKHYYAVMEREVVAEKDTKE